MIPPPTIRAAVWLAMLCIGAVVGLLGTVVLWPVVGLGWWTFALPAAGAGVVALGELAGRRTRG